MNILKLAGRATLIIFFLTLFTALKTKGGTGPATLPVPHQSSPGYKVNLLCELIIICKLPVGQLEN